jgi:hypothetical protein
VTPLSALLWRGYLKSVLAGAILSQCGCRAVKALVSSAPANRSCRSIDPVRIQMLFEIGQILACKHVIRVSAQQQLEIDGCNFRERTI